MSYLTQARARKNPIKILIVVFLCLLTGSLLFFSFLSPVILETSSSSKNFIEKMSLFLYFKSKYALELENKTLKESVIKLQAENANVLALNNENKILSERLNISENKEYVRANIIERPGFSPYDFLVIDEGLSAGISEGLNVFYGNFIIGEVVEVSKKNAKVQVFSSSGKIFSVLLGDKKIPANATGLGGGSFEVKLPKGVVVSVGSQVVLADNPLKVFGFVSSVLRPEDDDFEKIYFTLPLNIYELSDVLVAI